MDKNHKKACFEYIRTGPKEDFNKPETWTTSTRHYMSLLEEKYPQDLFFSWSWPGLLIFPYWALYRKMILFGILSFFIIPMFWPLGHLIGGVIANPLYLYFVKRKVAIGKTQNSSTSWVYPLVALFFGVIIAIGFITLIAVMAPFKNS